MGDGNIIGKRLAEERMRNTADLRRDIRFMLEWHHLSTLYCRKASILIVLYNEDKADPVNFGCKSLRENCRSWNSSIGTLANPRPQISPRTALGVHT